MTTARNSTRSNRPARRSLVRGLTLIELLCALAVALTALSTTFGNLRGLMQGQRLQASASELETIVHLARSSAMLGSQTVRLAVEPMAGGSCVLIHTGIKGACGCDPQGQPVCVGTERVLHSSKVDASRGVSITSNPMSLAFSGSRGTVTPTATLKLADSGGRALHQVVNVMGRVRTCSPAGSMSGYPVC